MRNFLTLLILLILSFGGSQAQVIDVSQPREEDRRGSTIVDDSTRQVFGPEDTRYTYQPYIKYNKLKAFTIDTVVQDFHRFHAVPASGFRLHDLGNIGTALNPIFFVPPRSIGRLPGIQVYDPYYVSSDEIRYYNSLSPYSRFKIIWGGGGRAVTEANYTRNVNERINFGFEFKGLFIDKQINKQGRGDRQAQGTYYNLHGSYVSLDRRYVALAYFNRNRHVVNENGGIRSTTGDPMDEIFFSDNRQVNLSVTETSDLRTNYHLYHQYEISPLVQVYHEFDRHKQLNGFNSGSQDQAFFENDVIEGNEDNDKTKYVLVQNEVGIKGDVGKTFYNFYYRGRRSDMTYKQLGEDTLGIDTEPLEHFGGVNLRFGNDSLSYIEAFGEIQTTGNFLIGGRIQNSWFHAEASSRQNSPTFIQEVYRGGHNEWYNDFASMISTSVSGGLDVGMRNFRFRPSAGYSLLSNYIYFRQFLNEESIREVVPFQATGDISILYGEIGFSLTFWKRLNLISTTRFTNVSGSSADAVRIPEIFHLSQLSYNNLLFKGNLELQVGFDFHWKSDYYAMGYDPAIMQFYVQDDFEVYSYPLVDLFINSRVNRARWFLKLNNVFELIRDRGYFATPFYPGQTTILDFGIDWIFFD